MKAGQRSSFATGLVAACVLLATALSAQQARAQVTLSGVVYDGRTRRPAEYGVVAVVEIRKTAATAENGRYRIVLPGPGTYTVIVNAPALKLQRVTLTVAANTERDFFLEPSAAAEGVTVVGKRDLQNVSRYSMTAKQIKEVPASFGDSVNALTSLPGVTRTDEFFGPLVIRGGPFIDNNYFVDDIPVYSPLHFGGLHSVINNNLMSDIDLYPSAFPAQYGSASAAVIAINTVDEVKEFGGYTDLGLISATALIQTPFVRGREGGVGVLSPESPGKSPGDEYAGYLIASGRVGYLSIFVPIMYQLLTGEKLTTVPEYWDYQVKAKFVLDRKNSLTALLIGSKDYFKFLEENELEPSDDPLFQNFEFKQDKMAHSQGLYHHWRPSDTLSNRLIAFASLTQTFTYFNLPEVPVTSAFRDINVTSHPYVFGLKDRLKVDLMRNRLSLRGGPEYSLYYFTARGKTLLSKTMNEPFDPGDPDQFAPVLLDEKFVNHVFGGYGEARLEVQGLNAIAGVRSEHLVRSGETTLDPRGAVSYEFRSGTSISAAGGKYSYFFQTNPFLFDTAPEAARIGEGSKSEKAIHRVAGLGQALGPWSVKLEGFYNTFYDLIVSYPHTEPGGDFVEGLNSGRQEAYGLEVMLNKNLHENEGGLFGWLSYTYTVSRYKSGLPTEDGYLGVPTNKAGDPYGDRYLSYELEQRHALKAVAGYVFGKHTLSAKFQYYSTFPGTPVIDGVEDTGYPSPPNPTERWLPVYGTPYTLRFAPTHRLDLRYSYKTPHSWGYVSWYLEVINVYNYRPKDSQEWDYRYDYSDTNPRTVQNEESLGIIPNFGVEVKF